MFRTPFGGTPQHWYMAASLSVIAPCIVVFFVAQRYFIQGYRYQWSKRLGCLPCHGKVGCAGPFT